MSTSLRIVISSVVGVAVFAVLLFVPAAALERRMQAGVKTETRPVQKVVIGGTFIAFGAILVIPALDYQFGWSHVPAWASVLGDVMVATGLGLTGYRQYTQNVRYRLVPLVW